MTSLRDRVEGVLVGTAAGDALGAPYEFQPPRGPGLPVEMAGGGPWQPGEWTDDTAMAIAIAEIAAAGNDLRDFQDTQTTGESPGMVFLAALRDCAKPVVAAVEGHAVGIGATLLLHCDLAYAGAGATFRLPFAALGLSPEGGSSYLLPRIAGSKRAAELLMLAEPFGAETAREAGFVNAVVPQGEALATALDKARALAALPVQGIAATKQALRRGQEAIVRTALREESEVFHALRKTPEAQAIFAAFLRR